MKRIFTILMVVLLCITSSNMAFALMPDRNETTQRKTQELDNTMMEEEDGQVSIDSTGPENIVQEKSLRYNSTLRLKSKIYGLGSPPVYRYRSITSISTLWPSNYTGYHYHITSSSYTISSDKKTCTVKITGVPKNADGMILTGILHDTVVFHANS